MTRKLNLFIIKASPSVSGIGAQILERLQFNLSREYDCELLVYDQSLESRSDKYSGGHTRQFVEADKSDVTPFEEQCMVSDGFILLCPVYMGQVPGAFKITLDSFAYRAHEFPLLGKKMVILAYGGSNGARELAYYFTRVFTNLGAEIVSAQTFQQTESELDIVYQDLIISIENMCERINQNHYKITEGQEALFKEYKQMVMKELEKGYRTNKQKRWEELLPFDSLVEYLETAKLE